MRRIFITAVLTAALVASVAPIAGADVVHADTDVVSAGEQQSISMTATPGQSQTVDVDLTIVCQTKNHMSGTTRLQYDGASVVVPTGGSLGATTVNVPRPAGWPADGANCGAVDSTPPQASRVTVVAPTTLGKHTFKLNWTANDADVDVSNQSQVTITLTVSAPAPSDTSPPVITSVASGTVGADGWFTSNTTVTWSVVDTDSAVTIDSGCGIQIFTTDTAGTLSNCTAHSAGGPASSSTLVKLDKTAPTAALSASGTLGADGWFTSDVTVTTSGSDPVSGPVVCTSPQLRTVETAGTTLAGSCTNDAGLTTAASPLVVKIDKTGPSASLGITGGTPGANGWFTSAVTVAASGADPVSGGVLCTSPTTVAADTAGTLVQGSCTNAAGLTTAAVPLQVKVDTSDPDAHLSVSAGTLGADGWYTSDVTVHTDGSDHVSEPVACSPDQVVSTDTPGVELHGSCTDGAGRSTAAAPLTIKRDASPPSAHLEVVSGTPGANGWFTSAVTVRTVGDDPTSGVACSADRVIDLDTLETVVTGSCTNGAGLTTDAAPITIKLDTTAPTAALAVATGTLGSNGWYTSAVTVATDGADATSGPVTCTPVQAIDSDSPGTQLDGSCTNAAGLTTAAAPLVVRLDTTAPATQVAVTEGDLGANGWYTSAATVKTTGTDEVSGPVVCTEPQHLSEDTPEVEVPGSCTNAAGLTAVGSILVKVDTTGPSAALTVTGGTLGANDWYTSAVTVAASGEDAVSGGVTCTDDVVVSTETPGTDIHGSCTNAAGLTTDAAAFAVKLDTSPPSAELAVTNGNLGDNGWYISDVTVATSGADSIAGPVTCTEDQVLAEETTGTEVHGTCTNDAGLSADVAPTVVRIDHTSPTAALSADGTLGADGWYTSAVVVHTTGSDTISDPVTCTDDQHLTADTAGIDVDGSCTNDAGRTQDAETLRVKIDTTPPTAELQVVAGTPGANGWYTSALTVSAVGDDTTSGVACTEPTVIDTETTGTIITGSCTNGAGLTTTAEPIVVKLDTSGPIAASAVTDGLPGAHGWYVSDVTVATTGSDLVSGPVTCTADQHVETDTPGVELLGSCTNDAGLTSEAAPILVKLDETAPSATADVVAGTPGAHGWFVSDVTVRTSGEDNVSGPVTCSPDEHQTTETPGTELGGSCSNDAGLVTVASPTTVKLDKTGPTAAISLDGTLGTNGWYISAVTASVFGEDDIAAPVTCSDERTLTDDTAGTVLNGSCRNDAGLETNAAPMTVKLDTSGPSADAAVTAGELGANGWYVSDVTVTTSGDDDTSAPVTCTSEQTFADDSAGTVVNGSCRNDAGLTTAAEPVTVKLDLTNPTAELSVTSGTLGSGGWYTSDVTVHTSGADDVSDPVACDADQHQLVDTPGTTFEGSCTNDAGRTQAAEPMVVKRDASPPTAALEVVGGTVGSNGWFTSNVTIRTVGTDDVSGATCSEQQTLTVETSGTLVTGSCTNGAGLVAEAAPMLVKLDTTGPSAHLAVAAGTAGTNGWYTSAVTMRAHGNDTLSGPVTCTGDQHQTTETPGTTFSASCTNAAGLTTLADPLTVKVDLSAPSAQLAVVAGTPGDDGWYRSNVTVRTSGADSLSGLSGCSADQFQTTDTTGTAFAGTCVNGAGLAGAAPSLVVRRDATSPVVTVTNLAPTYELGSSPAPQCTTTDATSGVAQPATPGITGGNANGVGVFTATCAGARDRAGNTGSAATQFRVVYAFGGFLQPINDTAHQVGVSTSVFKGGSTVPMKFRLRRADGTSVSFGAAQWLTPVRGGSMSAPVDESLYSDPASSGTSVRFDAADQQYIYNWATPKAGVGSYWRIGVSLDDGQRYYVNIGLR